jgi:hypothetical protein
MNRRPNKFTQCEREEVTFHRASNLDKILGMTLNASIFLLEYLKSRPRKDEIMLD